MTDHVGYMFGTAAVWPLVGPGGTAMMLGGPGVWIG